MSRRPFGAHLTAVNHHCLLLSRCLCISWALSPYTPPPQFAHILSRLSVSACQSPSRARLHIALSTDTPLSYSAHSLPLSVHFLNSALTHVHFALNLLMLHTLLLSAHIPPALTQLTDALTQRTHAICCRTDDSVSGRQLAPGAHFSRCLCIPLFSIDIHFAHILSGLHEYNMYSHVIILFPQINKSVLFSFLNQPLNNYVPITKHVNPYGTNTKCTRS